MSSGSLPIDQNTTNTHELGNVMYTDYVLYFQLSGMILLLAMMGAIILTYRKKENIKRQSYFKQVSREKSSSVELKDAEFDKGVKIDD